MQAISAYESRAWGTGLETAAEREAMRRRNREMERAARAEAIALLGMEPEGNGGDRYVATTAELIQAVRAA